MDRKRESGREQFRCKIRKDKNKSKVFEKNYSCYLVLNMVKINKIILVVLICLIRRLGLKIIAIPKQLYKCKIQYIPY